MAVGRSGLRVVTVLHPVTRSLDYDIFGVVEEAVEDGGGDGAIVVENRGPLLEGLVGGHDEGPSLVALTDDLEEEIGAVLIDGEVTNLVQEEDVGATVSAKLAFEQASLLSGGEIIDDADGVGEEHRVAFLAGGEPEGGGKVGLSDADGAEEHHVGLLGNELQAEEVLNLEAVDLLGPIPLELLQGLEDREAGGLDASFDDPLTALGVLTLDEAAEVFDVVPVAGGRLAGQIGMVAEKIGQLEFVEMLGQERRWDFHGVDLGS